MKQFIVSNKKTVFGIIAGLLILGTTMSFQHPFGPMDKLDSLTEFQDTIPDKNEEKENKMTMRDYDRLISQMDKEIIKMQAEVNRLDLDKMHHDIVASLNQVNFDKIKLDIDKAIKGIDFDKIERNVQSALNEIDWTKVDGEIKYSLQEAKKEIEKINVTELNKEMDKAKQEVEKSKQQIKKINFDEVMNNANKEIIKAKEELKLTKTMFTEMEKDGLIDQQDGFTIEFKDKALFINGKKQSDATRDKYRKYIKGDSFKISIGKE